MERIFGDVVVPGWQCLSGNDAKMELELCGLNDG